MAVVYGSGSFGLGAYSQTNRRLLAMDPGLLVGVVLLSAPVLLWLASLGSTRGSMDWSTEVTRGSPGSRRAILERVALTMVGMASVLSLFPLAGVVVTVDAGGCAPTLLVPANPTFCVRSAFQGGNLVVSGQTSLPDGSSISVRLVDATNEMHNAIATVGQGSFSATYDMSAMRGQDLQVFVEFYVADVPCEGSPVDLPAQPSTVSERFGADGANLVGPAAVWLSRSDCGEQTPVQVLFVALDLRSPA
jgi:hypothetical protein